MSYTTSDKSSPARRHPRRPIITSAEGFVSPIPIFEKHWPSSPVLPVNLSAAAMLILNTQCRVPTSGELLSLALVLLVTGLSGRSLVEATKGNGQLGSRQKQNLDTIKQRTA